MRPLDGGLRELRGYLAAAPDRVLARVVGLLNGVEDRHAATELFETIRPRLRRLRPARPLRVLRLLAMPLEGALVPAVRYRGDPAEIPRSALIPLGAAVTEALGERSRATAAALEGHSTADTALIDALGPPLWAAAGGTRLPIPGAVWREAGLPDELQAPILSLCGALWRHGAALWALRRHADAIPEAQLRATLGLLRAEGASAYLAATRLLMRASDAPAAIARVAAGLGPAAASAIEGELRRLLLDEAAALGQADATTEVAEVARSLARRLEDAEAHEPPGANDSRRVEAARIRQSAAGICHARLEDELKASLLQPLLAHLGAGHGGDALPEALEATARDLRRLELAGRQLGGEAAFGRAISVAVMELMALGARFPAPRRVEVARLVEILSGREAAAALLRAPGRAGFA
jgi:hypothetical protein